MKLRVAIITAVWKRPLIFRAFLRQIQAAYEVFDACLFVAGNEEELRSALKESGLKSKWVLCDNKFVSRKFNMALEAARVWGFDYALIMGSDNFANESFYRALEAEARLGVHFTGALDSYLIDTQTGRAKYNPGYSRQKKGQTMGAGRFVHDNLCRALNYRLWEDKLKRGLDDSMTSRFQGLEFEASAFRLKDRGVMLGGLKSEENIWSFDRLPGTPVELEEIQKKVKTQLWTDYQK